MLRARRLPILTFPIKLDLGCGEFPKEGFTRLDINDFGQEIMWDATEGLPLPDNTVE
jgi:hypothetical protein